MYVCFLCILILHQGALGLDCCSAYLVLILGLFYLFIIIFFGCKERSMTCLDSDAMMSAQLSTLSSQL
ncbi:uncharacterized protein BO66DRAFT_246069 [Aspergillus aculeatinus CBS 121060]|uniref:Uncharacterized protein n=1 Tax=Aspergillus aculeatinus CBS 121060 TaxID=1448322 RepID=A0ACD1GS69_9EURO|nr:hypothetical protein BO66DRAFT_246069 [Aspergillus aculeatinus CBS 121060]RAH64174.1 hypothetical protein BO66DRAFT_246069 [Aspergillus aculeatinus CBS 121060]